MGYLPTAYQYATVGFHGFSHRSVMHRLTAIYTLNCDRQRCRGHCLCSPHMRKTN